MNRLKKFIGALLVSGVGTILIVGIDLVLGMVKTVRDDARFEDRIHDAVREELVDILKDHPELLKELDEKKLKQLEQKRR